MAWLLRHNDANGIVCRPTDNLLTLFKELKPKFQMTACMIGVLINISRFADSNTN